MNIYEATTPPASKLLFEIAVAQRLGVFYTGQELNYPTRGWMQLRPKTSGPLQIEERTERKRAHLLCLFLYPLPSVYLSRGGRRGPSLDGGTQLRG